MRHFFLIAVSVLILNGCNFGGTSIPADEQYVVMLSMDGFRWDYASRVETPWLDHIAAKGVMAEYSQPVFPTKTFPNHYSMATGLYPDNHGIVDNNFTCPRLGVYRISDRDAVENGAFYGGEPIWVTAEKQNVVTGSFFWVGSEAPVQGIRPTYWKRFDGRVPFTARIDSVISWLQKPEEFRPRLVTLYFQEPDSQGHATGPDSPEIDLLVTQLDSLVGDLVRKLNELPFADNINLIVTSDHGMGQISSEKFIDLSLYTPRDWYQRAHGGNPVMHVTPNDGMLDSVLSILGRVENITVMKKEDAPSRLNYGTNERIEEVIILADSAWSIGWGKPRESYYVGGAHGWDNQNKDMHTIFYAKGPAFRKKHMHTPIEVVDLYPLIAEIMNLDPVPVDGKLERVEGMLINR